MNVKVDNKTWIINNIIRSQHGYYMHNYMLPKYLNSLQENLKLNLTSYGNIEYTVKLTKRCEDVLDLEAL
jgi:hypothetical protein